MLRLCPASAVRTASWHSVGQRDSQLPRLIKLFLTLGFCTLGEAGSWSSRTKAGCFPGLRECSASRPLRIGFLVFGGLVPLRFQHHTK